METVLLIDIGSTWTKVTAVDLERERLLGTARAFTTVATDVDEGLQQAIAALRQETGVTGFARQLACSSAAGGLKMIAVGLVPDLTAEAGKRAALSAGAKVLRTFAFELTAAQAEEIRRIGPDIVLLCGGTDGGNQAVIRHNAGVLAAIGASFTVVVAGNRSAADDVAAVLQAGGKPVRICENVMPEFNVLNIEPAREAIRAEFLQRIVQAKGLSRIEALTGGILMPTPSAVLAACRLLAGGSGGEAGLGDLMAVDIGGATTDVYSIADGHPAQPGVIEKGLPEPFAKRTVEGDLGVRISARALVDALGPEAVCRCAGLDRDAFDACLATIVARPDVLPGESGAMAAMDAGLAACAVRAAIERHVGRIETSYSPFGAVYLQTGKDLTGVKTLVGTGGPLVSSPDPERILAEALASAPASPLLKPRQPRLLLDRRYIMAAMGLLAGFHPETALRIMKREIVPLRE